jgi:hypothetical protein
LSDSNNGSWRNITRLEIDDRAMRYGAPWHAAREVHGKLAHHIDVASRGLPDSGARA